METEHVGADQLTFLPIAEVRYLGQGFSLPVRFALEDLAAWPDLLPLVQSFHQAHQEMYGYSDAREPTEIVNVRLAAVGELARPAFARSQDQGPDPMRAQKGTRNTYLGGALRKTAVFERKKLQTGNRVSGPAIMEQSDTTTLLLSGWTAEVDAYGNLIMAPEGI
jgi:N-methylhydantoinase A